MTMSTTSKMLLYTNVYIILFNNASFNRLSVKFRYTIAASLSLRKEMWIETLCLEENTKKLVAFSTKFLESIS